MNSFATYLFLFSLGAFFVPILSKCVKIPNLVGEIIYGILLGYFLNTGNVDMSVIDFLSNMGFIILMFLVGLELNFDTFTGRNFLFVSLVLVVFYLFVYIVWKFLLNGENIFIMIPYTAMSIGVLYIILKSYNLEKSFLGQNLLMVSSIGEIATIILMIIFEVYHREEHFSYLPFLKNIFAIVALFAGAYILLRLILLFFWWFPGIVRDMADSEDHAETNVRLSMFVLLTMVAISSFFGLDLILGAFLGGVMLSFVFREKESLQNKLSGIGYGFFIPFFFIKVGWDFQISKENIVPMLILSLKYYGLILLFRMFLSMVFYPLMKNFGLVDFARASFSIALLLAAPMTLLIAIAKLGLTISALDEISYGALIITSLIGSVIGPSLFPLIYPKGMKVPESAE